MVKPWIPNKARSEAVKRLIALNRAGELIPQSETLGEDKAELIKPSSKSELLVSEISGDQNKPWLKQEIPTPKIYASEGSIGDNSIYTFMPQEAEIEVEAYNTGVIKKMIQA